MKNFFYLFGLLVMLVLTSCGSDEPKNESTSVMLMYNRAVDTQNNDAFFSQSNCSFVLRTETTLSMQVHIVLKVDESNVVEFNTDFMNLAACPDENYTYTFGAASVTASNHTISNLRGKINLVGPTFIQYLVDGRYQCYSTLQPYYAHTTTLIEQNGTTSYTATNTTYGLLVNNTEHKGTLFLFDFQPNESGAVYPILRYDGLDLEVTSSGYRLTGTKVLPTSHESNYDTHGTPVNSLQSQSIAINVTDQGQSLTGTIKAGTEEAPIDIALDGTFFNSKL